MSAQIEMLTARVAELEARLAGNSRNSSRPPSSDNPFTKPPPRSRRGKSGRRPGKQAGGPGARLEPRADPDELVVHVPDRCAGCGGDLSAAPVVAQERRQVFDLPPVRLRVVEHRAQRRRCGCGVLTIAAFPAAATAPTCYGPGVAALGTYLQQKISGSWRTETGADAFLAVRSYLSTARKQRRDALEVLSSLFTGNAWIPAVAH